METKDSKDENLETDRKMEEMEEMEETKETPVKEHIYRHRIKETPMAASETAFSLPMKKILVVPVRRKGGWLPQGHAASFLFGESYVSLTVPRDQRSGQLKAPLTQQERDYFESDLSILSLKKGDLSIHKKDDNYWKDYKIKLKDEVRQLDLSKPDEYIAYKVLLVNEEIIAPSVQEKFNKGTYKFCLTEEGYQNEEKVQAASNKKEAYKFFGKIENSLTKMRDFINVYYTQKPGGKTVPPNATQDFLVAEIERIIETDITGFLTLARDIQFEKKVLIFSALRAGALKRVGMTYQTQEGTVIGDNLQSVISYLDNPVHSDEVIRLKARIETAK